MNIKFPLVLLYLLLTGFHCSTMISDRAVPPREAIRSVKNFAVQFSGEYKLGDFTQYDLVIMDPDQARNSEADSLSIRKILPVAYLNIGEAEEYRWYYSDVKPEWLLGKNPNWDRHFYIDVNHPDWQKLVLDKILPKIFRTAYAGVFLDMIDIASPELYPATRGGVIKLISRIRAAYPDKIILMNNGVFLSGSVSDLIDGICVESVFASYDFSTKKYFLRTQAEYEPRARELEELQKHLNTRIFVIDYAVQGDTAAQSLVRTKALEHGFVPFVSTIELNAIYPYRQ
jgi:polysaccharide biosynthesis protein PelA